MISSTKPEGFDENTMFKVLDSLREAGLNEQNARDCINEMLNKGILFRERLPEPEDVPTFRSAPRSILKCSYCDDAFSAPSFNTANEILTRHINSTHGKHK